MSADSSTITSKDIRKDFSEHINKVSYGNERVKISRHGRVVAAIVSPEDLKFLEDTEDFFDREAIKKAIEEQDGEALTDWEDFKKEITE